MLAVLNDSSPGKVITVGAPQLVRPVAEGPDTADCVSAPRIAETEIVAVSITRTSRTGFFQLIHNVSERCGCGSNATCFPLDFNPCFTTSGSIGLARVNLQSLIAEREPDSILGVSFSA